MPPTVLTQTVTLQRSDVSGTIQIRREHCRVTQTLLTDLGRQAGEQIRIFLPSLAVTAASQSALYTTELYVSTVSTVSTADPCIILMDDLAIQKINNATPIAVGATLTAGALNLAPSATDGALLYSEPSAAHSFIERHTVSTTAGANQLVVIAPHGGDVDRYTAAQADTALAVLAGLGKPVPGWICEGHWGSGQTSDRWHITADDLQPPSFPALAGLLAAIPPYLGSGPFRFALAFHGNSGPGPSIIVGGRAGLPVRQRVGDALLAALPGIGLQVCVPDGSVPSPPPGCAGLNVASLGGTSTHNLIHRLAPNSAVDPLQGGIQIEQSLDVRQTYGTQVATAVAQVLAPLLA